MSTLACMPLKIVESIAGDPWRLPEEYLEFPLGNHTSNLIQEIVCPYLFKNDEAFKDFFNVEPNLESQSPKKIAKSEFFQKLIQEFPKRFTDKIKKIEQEIKDIDPALLGEKRSNNFFFLVRMAVAVYYIFKRIFLASNAKINRLFFCRSALKLKFKDLKFTFPEAVIITVRDGKQLIPAIKKIIDENFPVEEEAKMLQYILENALPQSNLSSFQYNKENGVFRVEYSSAHKYNASANLHSVDMGQATLTVQCSKVVKGSIEQKSKKINFQSGFQIKHIQFLDKREFFLFLRKTVEKIEANSQGQKPPSLQFIQLKKDRKIKVQGKTSFSSFFKIPDFLTAPILSYATVEKNLSRINWTC